MLKTSCATSGKPSFGLAGAFCALAFAFPQIALGATANTWSSAIWAVVIGLMVVVIVLFFLARFFNQPGGKVLPHAFGLPPGTIRALIALSLVLTFIVLSFYFVVDVSFTGERAALADKVFITVSTALATILGFYFGSGGAKTAAQEMRKALGQRSEAVENESVSASAVAAADVAQAAADRAKNTQTKITAKLDAAKKANDPKAGMLELDVTEVKKVSAKAAAAAASAAARAKEIAKLTRDLTEITVAAQRKAIEANITELMAKLMADASDSEGLADKAEKIMARQATT